MLFAGVDESIRADVLGYAGLGYGWDREVRHVLVASWPDGPEAAIRDAVKELRISLVDLLLERYHHSCNEWLTDAQRAEEDRRREIAWDIRAEVSAESFAALVRAATGERPPEA